MKRQERINQLKKINDAKYIKENTTHFSNSIGFCVSFHELRRQSREFIGEHK
jgi:hypothetical protein